MAKKSPTSPKYFRRAECRVLLGLAMIAVCWLTATEIIIAAWKHTSSVSLHLSDRVDESNIGAETIKIQSSDNALEHRHSKIIQNEPIWVCYIAVGPHTLAKAARSAGSILLPSSSTEGASAESSQPPWLKTCVVTDNPKAAVNAFDIVLEAPQVSNLSGNSIQNYSELGEFAAFRAYQGDSLNARPVEWHATHTGKKDKMHAVQIVREAKIKGLQNAVLKGLKDETRFYEHEIRSESDSEKSCGPCVITLDADTVVCESAATTLLEKMQHASESKAFDFKIIKNQSEILRELCCQTKRNGASIAFVPLAKERWHIPRQLKNLFGVSHQTPEANTGVLVFVQGENAQSHSSSNKKSDLMHEAPDWSLRTIDELFEKWADSYRVLATADAPLLMDQPAFRAALHLTQIRFERLTSSANCRGRDSSTRTHAPLACGGVPEDPAGMLASAFYGGPEASVQGRRAVANLEQLQLGSLSSGCVVLHSHDLTDLPPSLESQSAFLHQQESRFETSETSVIAQVSKKQKNHSATNILDSSPCINRWIDVPFGCGDDVSTRDTLISILQDATKTAASGASDKLDTYNGSTSLCHSETVEIMPPAVNSGDISSLALIARNPLERVLVEYSACCIVNSTKNEWCPEEVKILCPKSKPEPHALGDAIAFFAVKRGNVHLKTILKGIRFRASGKRARLAHLASQVPPSVADLRLALATLISVHATIGTAERPRDTVDLALRGHTRVRTKRDVATPPPRSPLSAELSDAHLRAIRHATILDKALYDFVTYYLVHNLAILRSLGSVGSAISVSDSLRAAQHSIASGGRPYAFSRRRRRR